MKEATGAPAAPVDKEDFFIGGGAKPEPDEFLIEVWSCNWKVFVIYRSCQLTHVGMSGTCIGLSMQEITTALALHQVPPKRWRWYADQLQMMGRAAAEYYAESAKKKE